MKVSLLKGLTDQQVDEMRQDFASAANLRQHLINVLKDKIETNNKLTRSKSAYEIANWGFLQADGVGYERGLLEVISLLTSESTNTVTPPAVPQKRKYTRRTPKT